MFSTCTKRCKTDRSSIKKEAAEQFCVNEKSIQRDLDSIRDFLSEQTTSQGLIQSVEFDRAANGYRLVTEEVTHISEGEMLAICKILLESRAFDKAELKSLVNKVMNHCVSPKSKIHRAVYLE